MWLVYSYFIWLHSAKGLSYICLPRGNVGVEALWPSRFWLCRVVGCRVAWRITWRSLVFSWFLTENFSPTFNLLLGWHFQRFNSSAAVPPDCFSAHSPCKSSYKLQCLLLCKLSLSVRVYLVPWLVLAIEGRVRIWLILMQVINTTRVKYPYVLKVF
jgi:hypothetical protein